MHGSLLKFLWLDRSPGGLPTVHNVYTLSAQQEEPMSDAAVSSTAPSRAWTEDWLAVWIGLLIFAVALAGLAGKDTGLCGYGIGLDGP
jgi:hypothetical protein